MRKWLQNRKKSKATTKGISASFKPVAQTRNQNQPQSHSQSPKQPSLIHSSSEKVLRSQSSPRQVPKASAAAVVGVSRSTTTPLLPTPTSSSSLYLYNGQSPQPLPSSTGSQPPLGHTSHLPTTSQLRPLISHAPLTPMGAQQHQSPSIHTPLPIFTQQQPLYGHAPLPTRALLPTPPQQHHGNHPPHYDHNTLPFMYNGLPHQAPVPPSVPYPVPPGGYVIGTPSHPLQQVPPPQGVLRGQGAHLMSPPQGAATLWRGQGTQVKVQNSTVVFTPVPAEHWTNFQLDKKAIMNIYHS